MKQYTDENNIVRDERGNTVFTKEMKETHTILFPQMLPIHFDLIMEMFKIQGYKVDLLTNSNFQKIGGIGTKYVHNDMCVPAILVIGQLIEAIQSGKYDVNKVAVAMTQTGGGCRASNYLALLRKALKKAGLEQIPVVSINFNGLEKQPGWKLSLKTYKRMVYSIILGDTIMWANNRIRTYEVNSGDAAKLTEELKSELVAKMQTRWNKGRNIRKKMTDIIKRFDQIPVNMTNTKPRVGVVGEIYVKFAPLGNNNLEEFLINEGCEVVVPGLIDFVIYTTDAQLDDIEKFGGKWIKKKIIKMAKKYFIKYQDVLIAACNNSNNIPAPARFEHLKELVDSGNYVSTSNKMGEGWLLTAEMLELIEAGVPNIVCTQPFGCLPNHISGKGMFKAIKAAHPEANIIPVDYDPGATAVNQQNRIKLMLSNAKKAAKNNDK